MENKLGVRIMIVVGLLTLGLGLQHALAGDCGYTQLQCIQICEADDTPHDTCVRDCGCSSVSLLRSGFAAGLGVEQHAQVRDCGYTQMQCIQVCEADDTSHDTCVRECGCASTDGQLRSDSAGHSYSSCRLGCSSKCNDAHKLSSGEHVKGRCNDLCHRLCAKGVDIAATAAA